MNDRNLTNLDQTLTAVETVLRGLFSVATTTRPYPAEQLPKAELSDKEREHVAGLMRVNHAGEVAAQGLYLGHALSARSAETRAQMHQASKEENDHLAWCKRRLDELNSHPSRLDPLWFSGALAIGTVAGILGDNWSLGFVAETEDQVVRHLQQHSEQLPEKDLASHAVLQQMQADEAEHADKARAAGAAVLPQPVQALMRFSAKIMTNTAYHV